MAGENVTTALRADIKELRVEMSARIDTLTSEMNARIGALTSATNGRFAETNARIDTLAGAVQSLQREISTLRWMIRHALVPDDAAVPADRTRSEPRPGRWRYSAAYRGEGGTDSDAV